MILRVIRGRIIPRGNPEEFLVAEDERRYYQIRSVMLRVLEK
jgi:hypothetical protein